MIPPVPNNGEPISGAGGRVTRSWFAFFRAFLTNFSSQNWTPQFTGLTVTGTATVTAKYTLSGGILYFDIEISPDGVSTTQSTAGVTVITNSPFLASRYSVLSVLELPSGAAPGLAFSVKNTRTIALPSWGPSNETILISGSVQIGV